jgi:hypothetical protein
MADNVTLPGTGEIIATDDIGNVQYQKVKLAFGPNNTATDVTVATPYPVEPIGELVEAVEALRMAVHSLTRTLGLVQPDTAARMRVVIDAITGSLTLSTISTVSTLTTCSTLSNQTQIGSNPANEQIPALMRMAADSARRNISTS